MNDNLFIKLFDNVALKAAIALFGLIGTGVTIYAFLQEKKVDLRYEIIANTNVLDFNAEISKLEVTYDSTNLKQTKENLRIFTLKIINNGNQNILREFYDENDQLGFKLSTGKIIEQPEIIQVSNDYLQRNVKIVDYNYESIKLSQVILESGEYYVVKLLVLHKIDSIPQIESFGKIAGQTKIEVVNAVDVKSELTFWQKVYFGNIWVQLLRLPLYFIAIVLIFLFIALIGHISKKIDNEIDKKKRRKNINEFKVLKKYQYTKMDDAIFDKYEKGEVDSFIHIHRLLIDDKYLNELSRDIERDEFTKFGRIDSNSTISMYNEEWVLLNEAIDDGIIIKKKGKLIVNQAMKDTFYKFITFLKEKGELNDSFCNEKIISENNHQNSPSLSLRNEGLTESRL